MRSRRLWWTRNGAFMRGMMAGVAVALLLVHLTVRALGDRGERSNPKKADLEAWRQAFAEQLRMRGIAAEARPRRARGTTRKAERTAIRELGERHRDGRGPQSDVKRGAYPPALVALHRLWCRAIRGDRQTTKASAPRDGFRRASLCAGIMGAPPAS
jgi:hypothetical protein